MTRLGDRSFELEVLGAERRTTDFEKLYRPADEPLQVGQAFRAEELGVSVLDVRDGLMTRARFELSLQDSGRACFAAWRDGQVRAVESPDIGKHVLIPHEPGPMGM